MTEKRYEKRKYKMKKSSLGVTVSVIAVLVAIAAVLLSDLIQPGRAQFVVVIAKVLAWLAYVIAPLVLSAFAISILYETYQIGTFAKLILWASLLVVLAFLYPLGGAALDKWVSFTRAENFTTVPWTIYVIAQYLLLSLIKA